MNSANVTGRSTDFATPPATRVPGNAAASVVGSSGVIETVMFESVVSTLFGWRMTAYGPLAVDWLNVVAPLVA